MKKNMFLILTFAVIAIAEAAPRLTPEQVEKRRKAEAEFYQLEGGFVYNRNTGAGKIAIIDAQARIPAAAIQRQAVRIETVLTMPVGYSKYERVDFSNLDLALMSATGSVSVVITENEAFPTLMSLPEKKCVIVNVTALSRDGAPAERIQERVQKEIARGVCFVFQINYVAKRGSVFCPIYSLTELDKLLVDNVATAQKMYIDRYGKDIFGVRRYKCATYREACQEGWAPQPRDEVQRKIMEQVHAVPQTPMKIKFDPKQGR